MELNLQPNNTSFISNPARAAGQQQQANPPAGPVPPLLNASDLSSNPSARNLQDYQTNHPIEEEPDTFNLPEYQPIKPGAPYLEKLANEAMNTKKLNICLKNAQENEELEDFKDAEESYEKALKYTDDAEHYELYAACLKEIYLDLSRIPLTPSKDEAKERLYKEKAAKAFYYLGKLYEKSTDGKAAQAAYKASHEIALHELPLKALLDVARQIGEKGDIVDALDKLADFYAGKGDTALAIKMLEEAVQVEKSSTILEKLAVLCGQAGREDSQLKVNETRIQQFELQISEDPKNIGVYRKYVWFLKDIGRRNEARAVKERMDGVLQQKLLKQKIKIGEQKSRIQFLEQKMELDTKVFSLDFSSQPDIQDSDLVSLLKKNRYIKFLNLEGCTYLTNAVLAILPEYFENLKELNLTKCTGITAAGLECIAEKASKLKRLTLDHCPGTTIKVLHKLNAKGIAFSIKGLSFKYNKLDLSARKDDLTDTELLKTLETKPEITELSLYHCQKITGAGLAPLKNFQWLLSLNLHSCTQLTDAGLQYLAGLTQLTELNLCLCTRLTDVGLQHLRGLTQLKSLELSCCDQLTDVGLQHLAGLTQLKVLGLGHYNQLTDAGLQHLKGLTQLTSLGLTGCKQLTDVGLQHLHGLTQLTSLNLYDCIKFSGEGLQHLAGMTKLTRLDLRNTNLRDPGLQHLKALTWLSFLYLGGGGSQLTDAGLRHLKDLPQLTELNLYDCSQLTDAGLQQLAGLTQLRTLGLYGYHRLSSDAKEQLKKQMPGLTIYG